MKIDAGIHRVVTCYPDYEGIPLHAFVAVGSEAVALIDAGIPGSVSRDLEPFLLRIGLSIADIDRVLVTHGHPDHVGGVPKLREVNPEMAVVCSREERPWVEDQGRMFEDVFMRFPESLIFDADIETYITEELGGGGAAVSRTVEAGDIEDLGGVTLEWIDGSGHSGGHMALYDEHRGILFTGDSAQGVGIAHTSVDRHLPPLYEDAQKYIETQRRYLEIGPHRLLSTHHPVLSGTGVDEFLSSGLAFAAKAEQTVITALRKGRGSSLDNVADVVEHSLAEAYSTVYDGRLQLLAVTAAHLRRLQLDGVAAFDNGVWYAA